ncbi:SDR family NAD(P)-dependent oxidoreductase [Leisingera daeponensis]|uniref:SDR family NAD(P)-dependent oxidoreductase n=1 Tax=Leisingera daeponensis TaxID=405746 RepID=UPI001C952647|nr:SDR family NAD(P)-dependent oxidoreductase [Leisingera daeponensis]MBY6059017.1 SDR family oxidoreductase [Leisingera daeponensis]
MKSINGKSALVTGGARGMGAAISKALAAEGATVTLTYAHSDSKALQVVSEIEAAGGRAQALQADNRNVEALEKAVHAAASFGSGLDILVNNAGVFDVGPIETLGADAFDNTLSINVRGTYLTTRAAAEYMGENGRIITIGSNLAARVPGPGISLYALSKAALVGFTKGIARELGPRRIAANIIHPGSTDTDMNPSDGPNAAGQKSLMAIPQYNRAEDVAGLVVWLAGQASITLTGSELTIDSGTNA